MATSSYPVVTVPFPYVEAAVEKRRPAVLITAREVHERHDIGWVLMITSASNAGWPDDIMIDDPRALSGLKAPSVVRPAKIATVDLSRVKIIGALEDEVCARIRSYLAATLGLVAPH